MNSDGYFRWPPRPAKADLRSAGNPPATSFEVPEAYAPLKAYRQAWLRRAGCAYQTMLIELS